MNSYRIDICDLPQENIERGDDMGMLLSHNKQKTISLTWKQQVIMHSSLKFSLSFKDRGVCSF